MSTDVEDLLQQSMQRFTEGVRAPAGLAHRASRRHRRRRWIFRGTLAGGAVVTAAAAAAVALTVASTVVQPGSSLAQARAAYVVSRVKTALAAEHRVFVGSTMSTGDQPSVTWAYGAHNRFEEFTGPQCGQVNRSGDCSHQGGSVRYLATGTALVSGKLTGAYVTYYDHKYSLSPVYTAPPSACGKAAALGMGGPPVPTAHWSSFIKATLDCGAAKVTGHVWINGQETIQITGKPITVRLSPGYGKTVHERYARALWTLYVNPSTYLPVRMIGVTEAFGGSGGHTRFQSVTNVRWLPPTSANAARALVTIPPGYHQVSSPADQ